MPPDAAAAPETDMIEIKIALARIEERQNAAFTAAEHRHANMRQALDTFIPRREVEADNRARDERVEADNRARDERIGVIEKRVASLEAFRTWLYRTGATIGAAAIGGLAYLGKKMGFA